MRSCPDTDIDPRLLLNQGSEYGLLSNADLKPNRISPFKFWIVSV